MGVLVAGADPPNVAVGSGKAGSGGKARLHRHNGWIRTRSIATRGNLQ